MTEQCAWVESMVSAYQQHAGPYRQEDWQDVFKAQTSHATHTSSHNNRQACTDSHWESPDQSYSVAKAQLGLAPAALYPPPCIPRGFQADFQTPKTQPKCTWNPCGFHVDSRLVPWKHKESMWYGMSKDSMWNPWNPCGFLVDLGCGWGGHKHPGIQGIHVESLFIPGTCDHVIWPHGLCADAQVYIGGHSTHIPCLPPTFWVGGGAG